jgi:heme-degrading monooxygenase HmoA
VRVDAVPLTERRRDDRSSLAGRDVPRGRRRLRRLLQRERYQGPGNRGAWILRRSQQDRTEFIALSFWDSLDAIRGFAGENAEQAVFFPEDDCYLIDRELHVDHYELLGERS